MVAHFLSKKKAEVQFLALAYMTEKDKEHLNTIREFLDSEEIHYTEETIHTEFPNGYSCDDYAFYIQEPDHEFEIRYVNSLEHRMDYEKRFGYKGIPADYFGNITKKYFEAGKRVFWIKDYEITEANDIIDENGNEIKDYHRKWEVIKSYLRFATGKIRYRIYARDCEVVEVPTKENKGFMLNNCFYGYRSATVYLGLKLKKDKYGLKKGTLVFLTTFGLNFYGNKADTKENAVPQNKVEVVRVGSLKNSQIIGGSSKLLRYFLENYPTLTKKTTGEKFEVNEIVYYLDMDHSSASSMKAQGYDFVTYDTIGFHNFAADDIDIPGLKVSKGEIFQRKPMIHHKIMELMGEGKIISIGNSGTMTFNIHKKEYLEKLAKGEVFG